MSMWLARPKGHSGRRAELVLTSGALMLVVASMLALAIVAMALLAGARGYTQGEARWSKGQKDAVLHLFRFAHSHSESEYARFRESIGVPLACREIRLRMELPRYDPAAVAYWFAKVGMNPSDREGMIWLYRHLHRVAPVKKAIVVWAEADDAMERLQRDAARLHDAIASQAPNQAAIEQALAEIYRLNDRLTPLEEEFSQRVAEAGRWLHGVLILVFSIFAAVLVAAGSLIHYLLLGRIANSEDRYRHLIDTASEAIVLADGKTGRIRDYNRKAEEMLGTSSLHLAGTVWPLLGPERSAGRALPADMASLDGAKRETRLRTANGSWMDVEFSGSVVEVRGGPLIELILSDVTDRKKSAAELRAARDDALAASRAKSQFLANMSHEIRTPMNGVIGMLGLALEQCSDPEQEDRLLVAQNAANSLVTILNEVLDLSRIESGKLTLEEMDFDLRALFQEALRIFDAAVRDKKLRLELRLARDCPAWVRGDPARLRQVLVNLVGNAVKFTAAGYVEVHVARAAEGWLRLEVRDSGIGIAADKLHAIFEAFTQADGSHTRRFGGSGLGLTITRRLVDLMGGRVWAESQAGHGSSLLVELPLAQRPAPAAAEAPAPAAMGAPAPEIRPSLEILVAEDNPVNQKVLCAMLRRPRWSVTLAANGREAYERFLQARFDLVLMDIQMPEVDGLEATHLIRRHQQRTDPSAHIPIVAVTANAFEWQHDRWLEEGMDAVLTKPVDRATLLSCIAAVLGNLAPA